MAPEKKQDTFTVIHNGVTFTVRVHGWAPNYGFIINAHYKGVQLYTLHHKYRFIYYPNSRQPLIEIAEDAFKADLLAELYNLAAKTAHGMREDIYRPFRVL